MERYLKAIAKELKLIRKELQEEGRFIRDDELPEPKPIQETAQKDKPTVAESLNKMFDR